MVRRLLLLLISVLSAGGVITATAQSPKTLTAQDKAEIQALVTAYARTLGSCAANDYADLFAPETGSFDSGFRGHVVGRERLVAMVQSERQCIAPPPGTTPAPRPGPTVAVEVTPAGVFGIADLGGAGHYEDEYVKTPRGWRFAARTVITPAEQAAGLNAREMTAIRSLASGPDDASEFWAQGQDGVKRFRSAGVVILVAAGQVAGRVYLKDGGYYDDVYEKNARGQWRFKTRTYVAPGT
jgi:SnoaL-like protein